MTFQIKNIALYGLNGKTRTIELFLNSVNIITGQSGTGKSALLHIIDYCLGRRECNVPAGPIRKTVAWYSLKIQSGNEEVIIARRNPSLDQDTSEDIYFEKGTSLEFPSFESLQKNANLEALNALLNEILNIEDYSHEPPAGQTRKPGSADISKALFFCFQEQNEIGSQKFLFHRQGEPFIPQAIKDFLPFFLGVVTRDYIQKKELLRRNTRQLEILNSKILESKRLRGESFKQAHALINEAKRAGLVDVTENLPSTWDSIADIFQKILDHKIGVESDVPDDRLLDELLAKQEDIRAEYRKIERNRQSLLELRYTSNGFGTELKEQKSRLESIELFDHEGDLCRCPLCDSELDVTTPSIEQITSLLKNVNKQIESVSNDSPYVDKMIAEAEALLESLRGDLQSVGASIQSLQETSAYIQQLRDTNSKKAMVKGRISFYVEHMPEPDSNATEDEQNACRLERQITKLEEEVKNEILDDHLNSILSVISSHITTLAHDLKVEHSDSPIRLDINRLTVVADTDEGPYPMWPKMGSAETWVSMHVVTHLALHDWFTKKNRPVPRFVFFDQPSQAYFPADTSAENIRDMITVKNADREAVIRLFKLIERETKGFQVIITEHANINENWYQDLIRESWWDGKTKLVPLDWIDELTTTQSQSDTIENDTNLDQLE